MFTEPTEDHRWLHRMLGDWTFEHTCDGGPGAEPMKSTGTERVEAFSDLWVVGEGEGEIPGGGRMRMRLTLGFDPDTGRYTGTWIGSPMATMFVYDGIREGDTLTLDTTGPAMDDLARTARYQDIVELHGDDRRVLRSRMLGGDGSWIEFMRGEYRRVGK